MHLAIGMISGCTGTMIIQPIDMIKVRLQIKNEELGILKSQGKPVENVKLGFVSMAKTIMGESGALGLYKGLSSALMRQVFYATTRLGLYKILSEGHKKKIKQDTIPTYYKVLFGITSGVLGCLVGNPADLCLVRIQSDTQLPVEQRRNYTGFFNAIGRIIKEEGVLTLWRGSTPTVVRGTTITVVMLSSFDEVKEKSSKYLKIHHEALSIRVFSSLIAGTLAAFSALPFDNAKTKIQKMKALPDGTMPYKNIFDAIVKTATREGVFGLWVGMSTFYFRCAGHIVLVLMIQDFLTIQGKKYFHMKH